MIKKSRLLKTFVEIASIPGLSKREERIASALTKRLTRLGIRYRFDNALQGDGEVGNLIAYVKGTIDSPPLLINAHMDTVGPMDNWSCRRAGNFLETRGKSILGADNRSGVASILEVLTHLVESKSPRPPLEIVITVAEEIGLLGAKQLDYGLVSARHGIVLDSDSPLEPVVAAPEAYKLFFKIHGKEAHAGVAPERGINAISIVNQAISRIKIGRIDFETTANIGIIHGGTATNIVPNLVEVHGEARSHNAAKLKKQIAAMRNAFKQAVKQGRKRGAQFAGLPRLEDELVFDYPLMHLTEKSLPVRLLKAAGKALGKEVTPKVGGGGSDANIFNSHGIECIILGSGMERVHSVEERLNIDHLYLSAQMLAQAIKLYPSLIEKQ